jgi:hypothetical protein
MHEPESSQRASSERIIVKRRNDDSSRIPNDYMSNCAVPVNEDTDLAACFTRELGKVFGKFRGYDFIMYPSPIDPLEGMKVASLES